MKPPPFEYHRPGSVTEAVALLARLENAKVLAGGQSLMAMMNLRYLHPDHLVDVNRIPELADITVRDGVLRIGAMTRQRRIELSEDVEKVAPILPAALRHVGHRQTRNRGTIGGSLCHLDPAAELPMLALLYDARVTIAGPKGERRLDMSSFIAGYMTPSLTTGELVTVIEFPLWSARHGYGFCEFSRRRGDFAIAAAGCLMECGADGRISRVAIAIGGVASTPVRLTKAEAALQYKTGAETIFAEAAAHCADLPALGDVHGSAEYRKKIAAVMVRRGLAEAYGRAMARQEGRAAE